MSTYGKFVGTVKSEWVESDRKMKLLEDFIYIDPSGDQWEAPKESIIDGASIPRLLWTMVGSPFAGDYRNASVVHDVACDQKSAPWKNVHRMFFYACRCGGVGEKKQSLCSGRFGILAQSGAHRQKLRARRPPQARPILENNLRLWSSSSKVKIQASNALRNSRNLTKKERILVLSRRLLENH